MAVVRRVLHQLGGLVIQAQEALGGRRLNSSVKVYVYPFVSLKVLNLMCYPVYAGVDAQGSGKAYEEHGAGRCVCLTGFENAGRRDRNAPCCRVVKEFNVFLGPRYQGFRL